MFKRSSNIVVFGALRSNVTDRSIVGQPTRQDWEGALPLEAPTTLPFLSFLECKEADRAINKRIVPVELFEDLTVDIRERFGDEGDQLRKVALGERLDDPVRRRRFGGRQSSELGHIVDHRPLFSRNAWAFRKSRTKVQSRR